MHKRMGGGGSKINIDKAKLTAEITQDVTQDLTTTCDVGNQTNLIASNVTLRLDNIKCNNIDLLNQTVVSDPVCVNKASLSTVATVMAEQLSNIISSLQQKGDNPVGRASILGFNYNASTTKETIRTSVQQYMSTACNQDNVQNQIFENVVVDMQDVNCNSLTVLTQRSSDTTKCYIQASANAIANDSLYQQGIARGAVSVDTGSNTWIWVVLGVIGALLVITVIAVAVRGNHHGKHAEAMDVAQAVYMLRRQARPPGTPPTSPKSSTVKAQQKPQQKPQKTHSTQRQRVYAPATSMAPIRR
jgi:hypothetical protein